MSRKENQERARESKMIWSVMDFLLDEVVLIDTSGEILWVNQAWRDFAQQNNADEMTQLGVGMNYFEVCRKASEAGDNLAKEVLAGLLEVSARKRMEYIVEYPCRTPHAEFWFRMRAFSLDGQDTLFITHHNISDRVHAENAFQSEADRFSSLVGSMADIVFLLDTDGRHVGVYGQWIENYGLSEETFIGKTAREILGEEAAKVHEEANARALAGENVTYEWSYQDRSGEHVVQTHLSPMRDLTGKIHGIVGVGRDLTDRVKLERVMEEQTQILSRLNEMAAVLQGLQTPSEVYEWITRQTAELLQAPKVLIAIRDRESDLLEAQSPAYGFDDHQLALFKILVKEGEKTWDFHRNGSLLANRLEELPLGFRDLAQRLEIDSVLAVQIDVREHMGGLVLAANKEDGFRDQDRHTLEIIAQQAGGVLNRLQLLHRLQRRLDELQVLHLVSKSGVEAETEDEIITRVTEIVGETLYPDNFGVLLLVENGKALQPHSSYRGATTQAMMGKYPIGKDSIAGVVAQTRRSWRIDDITQVGQYFQADPKTQSELCVPIVVGNEILGVLNVESHRKGAFTKQDEQLLTTIAGLLASALQRLRRAEVERRALGIAESLVNTAHALSGELDVDVVLQRIFESLERILPYQSATIVWLEGDHNLRILHKGQSIASDDAWMEFVQVYLSGEVQKSIVFQVNTDGHISICRDASLPTLCCGIISPLSYRQKSLGILSLEGLQNLQFGEDILELISVFAEQAALSLTNASLYSQARQDAERRTALHQASQQLIEAGYDFEAIYQTLHQAVKRVMPAEAFVVSLLDEGGKEIRIEYAIDCGGRAPKQVIPLHRGLSGWVIDQGKSLMVNDLVQETQIASIGIHFGTSESVRSLVVVPLRHHQISIGMITAQSYAVSAYTSDDVEWLEMLAANAAGILQNARLYRETQLRADEMAALLETTRDLAGIQDLSTVLELILERITRLLEIESGEIYLYDRRQGNLELVAVKNIPISLGVRLEMGEGLAGRVAREQKPIMVEDYASWEGRSRKYDGIPLTYALAVPMIYGGEFIGVLGITAISSNQRKLSPQDAAILQIFATHAASAVHIARYFDQSQQRLQELEAINHLSKTLRNANTSYEMAEVLLDEALQLFDWEAGSVWLYDSLTMKLIPRSVAGWLKEVRQEPLVPGEGLVGWVFEQGQALFSNEFAGDERASAGFRLQAQPGWGGVVMPIASTEEVFGALVIASPTYCPLQEDELQLLSAFCEIAGNALQRARAMELLERRIQQLLSLRTVDNAINSSLDLRLTLDILLEQVLAHVQVEAADILLYEPSTNSLKLVAQRGYRSLLMSSLNIPVNNGMLAQVLNDREIQLITDMGTFEVDRTRQHLFLEEGFRSYIAIPLVAKGQLVGVMEVFRRDSKLIAPIELDFLQTLSGQAAIAIDNATLFYDLQQTNTQLTLAYDSTLEGWAKALELRDNETEGHSRRVAELTLKLAQVLGVSESEWIHIRRGAILHDIGKMGIPDEILHKPGPLSEAEWQIMKQHPVFAYDLLQPIPYLEKAAVIPYCHHERWDGSGYPQGLRGEQIPLAARIFAVVDVYDALCSDRPYRPAWTSADARAYLKEQAGRLFDARVVEAFLALLE